jgi:hypothetical protein
MPVYTQRGVVSGTIHLGSCHHITEVVLKVRRVLLNIFTTNKAST